ncbi:DUF1080 domain-containing protein [Pontiellaceae bacterium B12227]|nr:DUF1080 domain-containing protein [Pontiellaceae bacterium B12227]
MMKTIMTLMLAGLVSSGFASNDWKTLFNGKDFSGWSFDTLDKAAPETIWSVKDGIIRVMGKGKPNGVMRTEENFSNYEFEVEWRWPDKPGNNGTLIHCSKPRFMSVWPQSIEVQMMADNAGDFWVIGEMIEVNPEQIAPPNKRGPSRRRINLVDGAEKPAGEWNRMRVIARDDTVEVYVNDQLVNKGWNASVSEGAICLQAERANIEYRTIRIRELSNDWKPVFNGTDLSEFIVEDGNATYAVKDGVITGTTVVPSPNTFLATKAEYGDFELEFDVKVHDKLNSGVQIRSFSRTDENGKFKAGRFFGPQVEIEAGPGQAGYIYGEATGRGWLSPEPKSKDKAVNQHEYFNNGEWNHYRIVAEGARIQTFINGQLIADLADEEIYQTHPKGHLGFQVHGIGKKQMEFHPMTVSWKNLKIREL